MNSKLEFSEKKVEKALKWCLIDQCALHWDLIYFQIYGEHKEKKIPLEWDRPSGDT